MVTVTIGVKGGVRNTLTDYPVLETVWAEPAMHIDSRRLYDPKVKSFLGYAIPFALGAGSILSATVSKAHESIMAVAAPEAVPAFGGAIKEKVIHAFDPLIELITTLAFPIAGVMIAGGCLFIMVGNRERGMNMLQNAAIGYILVQLAPLMLDLLVGIGASV